MKQELKDRILKELNSYIQEWLLKIDKVKVKKGFATIQWNAKAILQVGFVTQLTFNEEHIKIKESEL
jgi:hypothetical protein